ncbi:unnamed protein product [Meloidogyne enterolobii]|uniref:Uncharacterized protein n=1 Tax=Meloidogyne enterolobii TaxID=390850 RepID=A0ACB0ZNN4_MELEN
MCTDNEHFKFNPIKGFLSANSTAKIDVLREVTCICILGVYQFFQRGPPASGDRCEILCKRVDRNLKDPSAAFIGNPVPDRILQVELLTR